MLSFSTLCFSLLLRSKIIAQAIPMYGIQPKYGIFPTIPTIKPTAIPTPQPFSIAPNSLILIMLSFIFTIIVIVLSFFIGVFVFIKRNKKPESPQQNIP